MDLCNIRTLICHTGFCLVFLPTFLHCCNMLDSYFLNSIGLLLHLASTNDISISLGVIANIETILAACVFYITPPLCL